MGIIIDFAKAKKLKEFEKGIKDDHGRTWIKCADSDPRGIWWNLLHFGIKVRCRLKYPHEENNIFPAEV